MNFGQELKAIRKEKNISIRKLAELAEISHAYISQIENGKRDRPKPDLIKKLSKALGVSYTQMLELAGHLPEGETEKRFKFATSIANKQKEWEEALNTFKPTIDLHELLTDSGPLKFKDRSLSEADRKQFLTILEAIFPN
jgi:transcriptional regulator with XRE-family HTH domain